MNGVSLPVEFKLHNYRFENIAEKYYPIVKAALENKAYRKWGKYYLPSLARAHFIQECNNFKDPGVQVFSTSKLREKAIDNADDAFLRLPPPEHLPELLDLGCGTSEMATRRNDFISTKTKMYNLRRCRGCRRPLRFSAIF